MLESSLRGGSMVMVFRTFQSCSSFSKKIKTYRYSHEYAEYHLWYLQIVRLLHLIIMDDLHGQEC